MINALVTYIGGIKFILLSVLYNFVQDAPGIQLSVSEGGAPVTGLNLAVD